MQNNLKYLSDKFQNKASLEEFFALKLECQSIQFEIKTQLSTQPEAEAQMMQQNAQNASFIESLVEDRIRSLVNKIE